MLGAIAGDIIGSVYERRHSRIKTTDFPLFDARCTFTDDTVLTVATADALLRGLDYAAVYRDYGRRYPNAGYGGTFIHWIFDDRAGPYNSWGNGSAMRVSPVGWAFDSADAVLAAAERSAAVTHNHPEGIKGAQATALAVFLARTGHDKAAIKTEIETRFGYNLSRRLDDIRPGYQFDVSCQGSVPEAIIAFLEADDVEQAIRLAISLGGDSDTLACIAGSIAEAFFGGIPATVAAEVHRRLPAELLAVVDAFTERYGATG
ncbi:MAG: ADP-ribosylglycohydrolase family protein [Anaerolineae bacterium]